MNQSIKWVTEWITPQLGRKTIERFLKSFHYGNEDFSGGLKDAWVSSSLKISAREQLAFMTRLWKGDLPLAKSTIEHTKNIIIIKKVGSSELYGKTGTGCLVGHACMDRPDKMIGTFVGVLMNGDHPYVVAANASDLKDQNRPAGPRLRDSTIEILTELGLAERDCAYCDGKK
jgi:beta-lactamase class D